MKGGTQRPGRPAKQRPDESPSRAKAKSSPARSPGRPRKSSPESPKKASGRRSPSRRSPARKSPSRRSPARPSPSRAQNSVKKSPSSRAAIGDYKDIDPFVKLPYVEIKSVDFNREKKTIDDKNGLESNYGSRTLRARKPKLSDFLASEKYTRSKVVSETVPKIDVARLENDLSEDDEVTASLLKPRQLATPLHDLKNLYAEFGGPVTALLMIVFVTALMIGVNVACDRQPCSFNKLPDLRRYLSVGSWVSLRAAAVVTAVFASITLFSLVPCLGKKATLPVANHVFVANGFATSLAIIVSAASVQHFYHPITEVVREDYIQLQVISVVFGIVLAFVLFAKSERVPQGLRNPNGSTGNKLYDFCVGREINPILFGRFPVKVLVLRYSLVLGTLINLAWMYENLKIKNFPALTMESLKNATTYHEIGQSISFNPTLYLFSLVQVIYLLDGLYFESYQVSTFEFMHEGVGLLICIGYFVYPFFHTILTKRLLDQNIAYSNWTLAACLAVFLIGYYIYRASNSQKSIFRENPLDRRVAHLQTLPTFQGKKLLTSGWWGFVRHPNYLGDLLIHLALGVGAYDGLPLYSVLLTFVFLVERVHRDAKRCSERYSIAWKRYCQIVPYNLMPKIY